MRQPEPPEAVEQLREFLRFAVPLRAATLIADHSPRELAALLPGMAMRAGAALGSYGDALQFSDGKPRTGRARDRVIRTADDLVTGIAAAALLAGPDGITILGDHYGPARPGDGRGRARSETGRPRPATPPGGTAVRKPRPVVDVHLPDPHQAA